MSDCQLVYPMEPNKRTMLLGGILAAVLTFGMAHPVFMQPLRNAEQDLSSAKRDLEAASANDMKLQLARKRLEDAKAACLPPSSNDAQRLYLEWITDLAQECNFSQTTVLPGGQKPRSGKYLLVSVVVEAEASLENFSRFLFQFMQADLTHRITKLVVNSSTTSGKPTMKFSLTAEGMGVIGSENKNELAARTALTGSVDTRSTQLMVDNLKSFPSQTPFLTKVGFETIRVVAVNDQSWTVERAVDGSEAQEHPESTRVRYFPVAWNRKHRRFEELTSFLKQPPFTKPAVARVYDPVFTGLENVIIAPGETATIQAHVDDYDTDAGTLEFSLEDTDNEVEIDAVTGQLRWETSGSQEPGEYQVTVLASQQNNPEFQLRQVMTIIVKLPNSSPQLSLLTDAVVLLGQEFKLSPNVSDDGGLENLIWTLEADDLPEGLTIDSAAGTLTWTPPLTFNPQTYTVLVKVTDKGDPPKSTSQSITLETKDDDARYSRLTAIVRKDGQPEAWFENTRTNSQTVLHVGDRLNVANINAVILEIKTRMLTLQDDQGIWELTLGSHSRARVLKNVPVTPDEPEAGETDESVESPTDS